MSWTHQNVCLLLLSMTVKMTRYVWGVTSCLSLLNFEFQASVLLLAICFNFFKCLVLVPIVSLVWFVEASMSYGLNVELGVHDFV